MNSQFSFRLPSAELGNFTSKGTNRFVIGRTGIGKSSYMVGLIAQKLNRLINGGLQTCDKIVVVDVGRSYELLTNLVEDSEFIEIYAQGLSEISPITLSNKKLTVFELESLRPLNNDDIAQQIIESLKKATTPKSLLIIDEWCVMNNAIKQWALTEFEGETIICCMDNDQLEYDKSSHLFGRGIEIKVRS